MDSLVNLRMSLLNFNFGMIYIIHKMLVSLKNHLDYFKVTFLNAFLKSIIDSHFSFKKIIFFITYNGGKSKAWRKNHI